MTVRLVKSEKQSEGRWKEEGKGIGRLLKKGGKRGKQMIER